LVRNKYFTNLENNRKRRALSDNSSLKSAGAGWNTAALKGKSKIFTGSESQL